MHMTQLAAILLAIMGQAVTEVMKNKSSMDVPLPLNITVTQNYSIINLKKYRYQQMEQIQ